MRNEILCSRRCDEGMQEGELRKERDEDKKKKRKWNGVI